MSLQKLKRFLLESNAAGYASGADSGWKKEKDGSSTIVHKSSNWKMHDNFFGGEPYGGREVVFHKGKPYWIMVYYGAVKKGAESDEVYKFLQESLRKMPKEAPYRGPKNHKSGEWKYENKWKGKVINFKGREIILKKEKKVYWAGYMGGLVNQS
jgi:hypothetical protein